MSTQPIRELFVSDVTRDIPPVVYLQEQTPENVAAEVAEYIITGGWPKGDPNRIRVPDGIHEQYVRLLRGISSELDKKGGTSLPACWISGFYGSGKSSFAKLLGLALDGLELPDGTPLAEAWLARDRSPKKEELRQAWEELRGKVQPLAVVFDIGGVARDNEHIHATAIRQVQKRLGYCSTDPLVAEFELKLERDGEWEAFTAKAQKVLGKPWSEVKDLQLAEDDFSLVMSELYPERYTDPMSWYTSRGGTFKRTESPEEAVRAIGDMVAHRQPESTVFLVIDEVSQYVLGNKDRVDKLRAFASALGSTLKGGAWLLALGQQKLDEEADDSWLFGAKDRFPPKLRVHLAATNIRDVVHQRLLQKTPEASMRLRELFEEHRPALNVYAYGCDTVTPDEFTEVYPLLPGYVDLLLEITTAIRTRSARSQGDDQAIRGLLQLLGELFRTQKLADQPLGALVTLDQVYEVQRTALDADAQASMARILSYCANKPNTLLLRAAKTVALLQQIQDTVPTDVEFVARCLYDRVDRGDQVSAVQEALEQLKRDNLLGYSEKQGFKLQSSAGEEWERERRDIGVTRERIRELVQEALKYLLGLPDRPRLQGRPFRWAGIFSDGRQANDVSLLDPRDDAVVRVDFRFLSKDERTESTWVKRSAEEALKDRIVWVAGNSDHLDHEAREFARSQAMVRKYRPRRESLSAARRLLFQEEENRAEDLETRVRGAVSDAWLDGKLYFQGRPIAPRDKAATFEKALHATGEEILPTLFPHFTAVQVQPSELAVLVTTELSGPSPKFLSDELGILDTDGGRYVPACNGMIPRRVFEHIDAEGGLSGDSLLKHFGRPPYGYTENVVKACVAGLLHAEKIRIQPEGGSGITAVRDAGVRDFFEKDRTFKRANLFPSGEDEIGPQARNRICKFFETRLGHPILTRSASGIADAAMQLFPKLAQDLRSVQQRLNRLPGSPEGPKSLTKLEDVLEQVVRTCRQTEPTVGLIKRNLDALRDGVQDLQTYDKELTAAALQAVREAADLLAHQGAQLRGDVETLPGEVESAIGEVEQHLDPRKNDRPWRQVEVLEPQVERIRTIYLQERGRLLQWQEQQAEGVRARIMNREGFTTLDGDHSHSVLRPVTTAKTDTTAEAISPPLGALKDPFLAALRRAEDQANERLDELLSQGEQPMIVRVELDLRNRELATPEDVEVLLEEIREQLLDSLDDGVRVRIV